MLSLRLQFVNISLLLLSLMALAPLIERRFQRDLHGSHLGDLVGVHLDSVYVRIWAHFSILQVAVRLHAYTIDVILHVLRDVYPINRSFP